ncbi:ferredoxin [Raphidocelis subcapitata]|uniref:Ferredoxin n=1 Tax=Raphidocelis subcapitata TaxID=307507 RepID=A0A2V0NQL5_9CHLO|nr:ferredoxin [Raphidocelis subcapitata]|eukprot:GBF89579.1 ferredoxin [Raphidocelis subcapitata]
MLLLGSSALHAPLRAAVAAAAGAISCGAGQRLLARGLSRSAGAAAAAGQQAAAKAAANEAPAPVPAVSVTVNGRRVSVPRGSTILDAVEAAKIQIPTLCKLPGRYTPGTCRVCMVDVNGVHKAACCTPAVEGSFVTTDTPAVREYVRGLLGLLRANHPEDCMTCDVNGRCEFQTLITRYQVPMLPKVKANSPDYREQSSHFAAHDVTSPAISLDRDKCIKCGRCVETCQDVQKMNVLGWFARGRERHIGFMLDSDAAVSACISCGQCVSVCPVGALSESTHWRSVLELLETKHKVVVVQTAPAVRVALGEELGLPPGTVATGQLVAALKALGFDHVFDTDFSADLTIMEEGTELLGRIKGGAGAGPLPLFTSCCPGWVNLLEQEYPEFIPHLSSCKSPQQMLGAIVKEIWAPRAGLKPEDVAVVSVMPCTAKKGEAARPEMRVGAGGPHGGAPHGGGAAAAEGVAEEGAAGEEGAEEGGSRHVDYVLTTRELGRMMRLKGIPGTLPPQPYDSPMGVGTGAAVLFGNSGGVTEAAVRTLYELTTGKPMPHLEFEAVRGLQGIKEASVVLPSDGGEREVRIAVVNGIANARKLLDAMRKGTGPKFDFVEVMTCIGGCIGGGGQPKSRDADILSKRMQAVYDIDASAPLRASHNNPEVTELYKTALGQPNSARAHELLHTRYAARLKH